MMEEKDIRIFVKQKYYNIHLYICALHIHVFGYVCICPWCIYVYDVYVYVWLVDYRQYGHILHTKSNVYVYMYVYMQMYVYVYDVYIIYMYIYNVHMHVCEDMVKTSLKNLFAKHL